MNILYLSPNMARYAGANYQHEVMQELSRQARVCFYGPGFPGYDAADTIADAIAKAGFTGGPDWIVCGHAWLEDRPGTPVEKPSHLDVSRCDVPKAAILNKEYSNLDAKLAWLRRAGIGVAFTHHHDAAAFQEWSGVPCVFWPFAADHRLFYPPAGKEHDLGFSGILQNPTPGFQSDLRVRVMNRLFECEGDLPVRAREWCAGWRIFFNALPRSETDQARARERGLYRRLDTARYAAAVRGCRAFLCTRSPADLVSPRYFECMLSRTLVIAERNPAHHAVFPAGMLLEFGDEDEFVAVATAALNGRESEQVVERAWREASAKHTWERRVKSLLARLAGVGAEAA
jgi:hypothetical protein